MKELISQVEQGIQGGADFASLMKSIRLLRFSDIKPIPYQQVFE